MNDAKLSLSSVTGAFPSPILYFFLKKNKFRNSVFKKATWFLSFQRQRQPRDEAPLLVLGLVQGGQAADGGVVMVVAAACTSRVEMVKFSLLFC